MDKQDLFRIGDIAELFHISVGSLRHYEKKGLVAPEYIDESTGYRYYSPRQFECLNTIRYLRVLDMPLPQIGSFLKNRNDDRFRPDQRSGAICYRNPDSRCAQSG